MTINVEDESGIGLPGVDTEETARRVIEAALDYEGCPYEAEVNLEWMEGAGENPVLRVITAIQLTEKEKQ